MIKEELLLFVEIEDRAVTVFVDWDLGTGVDQKKDAGDPSLKWNKGALFAKTHVSISSYKAALGSKKIEEKLSQADNNLERAKKAIHILIKTGITE